MLTESDLPLIKTVSFVLSFGLFYLAQLLFPYRKKIWVDFYNFVFNGTISIINTLIINMFCLACLGKVATWASANSIGFFNYFSYFSSTASSFASIAKLFATILILDLASYWWHFANHHVNLLWRFHQSHHSDTSFDVSTAIRFHVVELGISLLVRMALVVSFGIQWLDLIVFEIIYQSFNLFEHGNIRLNLKLEYYFQKIFISPALHRMHHSTKQEELNTNFGTIFSFWDKMFGTKHLSNSEEEIKVGLLDQPPSQNIFKFFTRPLS